MNRLLLPQIYLAVIVLLLLPSCGRMADWVSDSFTQAPTLESQCQSAQPYIKSTTTYDQFTTIAKFDALWLSDDVRMAYVDIFSLKFGKTEEQKKTLLRRQLEENNHFISFYVLTSHDVPLGDTHSVWSVFLQVDTKNYAPIEVKSVELLPEYICMFDKKINRFRVPYSVKFDAKNVDETPIITDETQEIKLVFRSVKREATLSWSLPVQPIAAEKEDV